jgi:transposase
MKNLIAETLPPLFLSLFLFSCFCSSSSYWTCFVLGLPLTVFFSFFFFVCFVRNEMMQAIITGSSSSSSSTAPTSASSSSWSSLSSSSSASASFPSSSPSTSLPLRLWKIVFSFLDHGSHRIVVKVCKKWREMILKSPGPRMAQWKRCKGLKGDSMPRGLESRMDDDDDDEMLKNSIRDLLRRHPNVHGLIFGCEFGHGAFSYPSLKLQSLAPILDAISSISSSSSSSSSSSPSSSFFFSSPCSSSTSLSKNRTLSVSRECSSSPSPSSSSSSSPIEILRLDLTTTIVNDLQHLSFFSSLNSLNLNNTIETAFLYSPFQRLRSLVCSKSEENGIEYHDISWHNRSSQFFNLQTLFISQLTIPTDPSFSFLRHLPNLLRLSLRVPEIISHSHELMKTLASSQTQLTHLWLRNLGHIVFHIEPFVLLSASPSSLTLQFLHLGLIRSPPPPPSSSSSVSSASYASCSSCFCSSASRHSHLRSSLPNLRRLEIHCEFTPIPEETTGMLSPVEKVLFDWMDLEEHSKFEEFVWTSTSSASSSSSSSSFSENTSRLETLFHSFSSLTTFSSPLLLRWSHDTFRKSNFSLSLSLSHSLLIVFAIHKDFGPIRVWSARGTHPVVQRFRRKEYRDRIAITGAICPRWDPPYIMHFQEESSNASCFITFCTETLLPYLQNGDMVIFDNATYHSSEDVLKSIKKVYDPKGIELFLLPPYSPQFNPIEQLWRELKRLLKDTPPLGPLYLSILDALHKINREQVTRFYVHDGYRV